MCNNGAFYRASSSEFDEPLVNHATLAAHDRYFLNDQIPGTGADQFTAYRQKANTVVANVREFRMLYAGMTLTFDAPKLSDQGIITSVQFPTQEVDSSFTAVPPNGIALTATRVMHRVNSRFPTFDELQNLPGVYSGKASEGAYVPLRMNKDDFSWKNAADTRYCHLDMDALGNYAPDPLVISAPTGHSHPVQPVRDVQVDTATGGFVCSDLQLQRGTRNLSMTSIRGISYATSIFVQFRTGWELTCAPGSIYTPYVRKPSLEDKQAVTAYFGISRQLADCYPETYNSTAALLPVIASLASSIIPEIIPAIGRAGKAFFDAPPNYFDVAASPSSYVTPEPRPDPAMKMIADRMHLLELRERQTSERVKRAAAGLSTRKPTTRLAQRTTRRVPTSRRK